MARKRNSIIGEFFKMKQEKEKAKAAEELRLQKEADRKARAADAAQKKREAEAKARRAKADAELRKQRADEAAQKRVERDVDRIQREAAQRDQARQRAETAEKAKRERDAKQREAQERKAVEERKREQAIQASQRVAARLAELDRILLDRADGLHAHRLDIERAFDTEPEESFAEAIQSALEECNYPADLALDVRVHVVPEAREILIDLELPRQDVVPAAAEYRYVASKREVTPVPHKAAEAQRLYKTLVARLALRRIDEAFAVCPPALVNTVVLNGHVSAKDKATGKPIRPCLVSLQATREQFDDLELSEPELDPAACLRHLNAIVSPHPYELEAVRPVLSFDLSRYKFVDEVDVVAGLDSRPDLLQLTPIEFEHLVRRLFEAYGMKAWVTQASRDDGVDAVAVNEDPFTGGVCVIQAKRTSDTVPVNDVRALAGVMNDMTAAKGILVTTSWFGKASRDFAARTGRMQLIDARELKALLKEHLGIDALIGLTKLPRGWERRDVT